MVSFLKTSKKDLQINKRKFSLNYERFIRISKIRTRLGFSYGILVLIPILIVGITSVSQSKNSINNKVSNFSSQIMSQIGLNISSEMDKYSNFARSIIIEPDFQNYFQSKLNIDSLENYSRVNSLTKIISNKAATKNDIINLGVISTENEKIGSFSTQLPDNIKNNLFNLSNKAKGNFIWSLINNSSKYSIYVSAQVNNVATGDNFGIVVEELNPKSFVKLFKNINLGDSSNIFIIDSKGTIILSEDENLIGSEYKDKSIVNKIQDNEKNLTQSANVTQQARQCFSTGDGKGLVSYSPLSGSDWYVVGVIPYSYLNSESNVLRNNTIIIGLISFIISMLVALTISKSISNPLEKLVLLMMKAKDGNLAVYITDESKDEIGEVIRAFNDMVRKISILISDVKVMAENVSNSTKVIAEVSEHSYSSSEEIAATMSEIAIGASNQNASVNEGMFCMNGLSIEINEVNKKNRKCILSIGRYKEIERRYYYIN